MPNKDSITLYNYDARDFITRVLPKLPTSTLVYLDPPYFLKGQELYENHYDYKDHAAVAKLITRHIKQKWIISYDDTVEIRKLYKGQSKLRYELSYSVARHHKGSEVMFFSDALKLPRKKTSLPGFD